MNFEFLKIKKIKIAITAILFFVYYVFIFGGALCSLMVKNCVEGTYHISLICPNSSCITIFEALNQYFLFLIVPILIFYLLASIIYSLISLVIRK